MATEKVKKIKTARQALNEMDHSCARKFAERRASDRGDLRSVSRPKKAKRRRDLSIKDKSINSVDESNFMKLD